MIRIGTDKVKSIYIGTDKVKKVYIGKDLVFDVNGGKTLVFSDTGVTGTANTDYTVRSNALHTVDSTGTKIYSNTNSDGYYRANQLISGDFEITFTFVEGGNTYYPDVAFLNSNNSKLWSMEHRTNNNGQYLLDYNGTKASYNGAITNGEEWKITRTGNVITFYVDGTQLYTYTGISTSDVYFAWKTHSHSSRWFRYRDLAIYKVD